MTVDKVATGRLPSGASGSETTKTEASRRAPEVVVPPPVQAKGEFGRRNREATRGLVRANMVVNEGSDGWNGGWYGGP